jgi:hypothetical protein
MIRNPAPINVIVTIITPATMAACGSFDEFEQWVWLQCACRIADWGVTFLAELLAIGPNEPTWLMFILSKALQALNR